MAEITIGKRMIGNKHPCFIIAEIGVNHNGDLATALKLIDEAARAGVDAAKFQLIRADGLYVKDAGTVKTASGDTFDAYKVWKDVEMPASWLPVLKKRCDKRGLLFFSSVFDLESVDVLDPFVDVYKIASSETTDIPLLKKVARTGKPVIVSLGGATLDEVIEAVDTLRSERAAIALLYCVQQYPMLYLSANVAAVKTLQEKFPDVVVGYSDHSLFPDPTVVPAAAVSYGANIIEKHFTLSRQMKGIDHHMSVEPHELMRLVEVIRAAEHHSAKVPHEIIGNGKIELTPQQIAALRFVRRFIFTVEHIEAGDYFTEKNIVTLRPGHRDIAAGLHPREYEHIIGKKAACSLQAGALLTRGCVHYGN